MSLAVRAGAVTRRFGYRWALRGIDLSLPRGVVVALLGANGTGKTTLLRVLSTLLRPTAGRVEVLGHALPAGSDAVRSRTGFMTAGGHAYDELTGLENLRFATRMSGEDIPGEASLLAALDAVGLGAATGVRVREYSTGMRKRLELARHRLRPVDLMLLDEPFESLDAEGIGLAGELIREWRSRGTTVIVASHRSGEAARHADKVLTLERGRIAAEASA